jgi:hypothetical protein
MSASVTRPLADFRQNFRPLGVVIGAAADQDSHRETPADRARLLQSADPSHELKPHPWRRHTHFSNPFEMSFNNFG